MVKAASHSSGLKRNILEFGVKHEDIEVEVKANPSAAAGIAS